MKTTYIKNIIHKKKSNLILLLVVFFQSYFNVLGQDTVKICIEDNIYLNAGSNYAGDIQWQSSPNMTAFTDITGADHNLYSVDVLNSMYYRAKVNFGTCDPFYSTEVFVKRSDIDVFVQSTTADFTANTNSSTDTSNNEVSLEIIPILGLGNGSDGIFNPSSDTALAGGIYNFTSFNIAAGITVDVTGSNPIEIFANDGATIDGTLNLAGEDGVDGVNNGPPGSGGAGGGGGGFSGGNGGDAGLTTGSSYHGQNGSGPGAGAGGQTVSTWYGGGGGGYAAPGTNGVNGVSGNGSGGPAYGSPMLITLQGGSGGGGGAGDDDAAGAGSGDDGGGGGGGGGGAVRIITDSLFIGASGVINVDGGDGGNCGNGGGGGGGSGGAIFIKAYEITHSGMLTAQGGVSKATSSSTFGGDGSAGRIRLDYLNLNNTGSIMPATGFTGVAGSYVSSGTTVSIPISIPSNDFCIWDKIEYDIDTSLAGTDIVIDIIDDQDNVIVPDVDDAEDLSNIPALSGLSEIKLKATLSTSVSTNTPSLNSWKVLYYRN